jgi:hypothetical protein
MSAAPSLRTSLRGVALRNPVLAAMSGAAAPALQTNLSGIALRNPVPAAGSGAL